MGAQEIDQSLNLFLLLNMLQVSQPDPPPAGLLTRRPAGRLLRAERLPHQDQVRVSLVDISRYDILRWAGSGRKSGRMKRFAVTTLIMNE